MPRRFTLRRVLTAEASHTLRTGGESCQLAYTAATRGRLANHLYLQVVGDGNEHNVVGPTTSTRSLQPNCSKGSDRDDSCRWATTPSRVAQEPATLLGEATTGYVDSLYVGAEHRLGPEQDQLSIAPAERLDVLIDFGALAGRTLTMVNTAPNAAVEPEVMQFRVSNAAPSPHPFVLPTTLSTTVGRLNHESMPSHGHRWLVVTLVAHRHPEVWEMEEADPATLPPLPADGIVQVQLPGHDGIPGHLVTLRRVARRFDDAPSIYIADGAWEQWSFLNLSPVEHLMHIHLIHFPGDGSARLRPERALQDVRTKLTLRTVGEDTAGLWSDATRLAACEPIDFSVRNSMRVLLSTIGSRGDVQPMVALGAQLQDLGHEVHLCVPPDFRDWITGLGLNVTTIGPEVKTTAARPASAQRQPPSAEQRRQMIAETVATQFATIPQAAAGCDVLVAGGALQIALRSVAETVGVPYVYAAYCPITLPSPHHAPPPLTWLTETPSSPDADNDDLWAKDSDRWNDMWGEPLNTHRAALGLAPVSDVRGHIFTDQPWVAADPTLGPWPDPADPRVFQPGAWIMPDHRPLSPEIEAFLDAGDAPVYFGFGSLRASHDELTQAMLTAARWHGRRAIISRGWANLALLDNEPNCLSIGEVNQQALFARCAAVIHHGGAGTTTTAAAAGTPQVVVPQLYDQHYWAQQVQRLGIGTAHPPGAPTTDSLTTALDHTLMPGTASKAQTAASTIRLDGAYLASRQLTN